MSEGPVLTSIARSLKRIADGITSLSFMLTMQTASKAEHESEQDFQEWLARATRAHKELMEVLKNQEEKAENEV